MSDRPLDDVSRLVASLNALIGETTYDLAAVGDLIDLRNHYRRGAEEIERLIQRDFAGSSAPARLFAIERMLAFDLPAIRKDLIPALRKMQSLLRKGEDPNVRSSEGLDVVIRETDSTMKDLGAE